MGGEVEWPATCAGKVACELRQGGLRTEACAGMCRQGGLRTKARTEAPHQADPQDEGGIICDAVRITCTCDEASPVMGYASPAPVMRRHL